MDLLVSKQKFDREIERYRCIEDEHIKSGRWLLRAEFPEVFAVFAIPQLKPSSIAFGVVIDFTNYDLWAPSVQFVDPFTRVPLKLSELGNNLPRLIKTTGDEGNHGESQILGLIQAHIDEKPFLCLPGVREYHDHPAHSGDSWLLHRGGGEGTLYFLLEKISQYGVKPINAYHLQIKIVGYTLDPQNISE